MIEHHRWSGYLDLHRDPGSSGPYRVGCTLTFRSTKFEVKVNAGFRTDGASVPRPFRWWADPFSGRYAAPAVIHDGLYALQATTRSEADEVLLEAMRSSGCRPTQAALIWAAVRAFGWIPWRAKTHYSTSLARHFVEVRRWPGQLNS